MHDCIHIYWCLEVLRDHFGSILGSWETTLASLWRSLGARVHSGGPLDVPRLIFVDFWWILDPPLGHFWVTCWYFMWFEVSKSRFGLQARFLMICDRKNCWFLMSQPLKNNVKTIVFKRFYFSDLLLIWMTSGTCLDLILVTLEGLGAPIWWFVGLLYRHWNFNEFHDPTRETPNWEKTPSGWLNPCSRRH